MNNTVKFKIVGDSTDGDRVINSFKSNISSLGVTIDEELAGKLKGAFSLAFLEEAARRTGEWAYNMEQVAKEAGISVGTYQSYEILGKNAEVAEGKVVSMYQAIASARDKALGGDQDSIQQLQALGISYGDITSHSSSADLFNKVLQNQSLGNVLPGSAMGRAVEGIFGAGSLPALRSVVQTAGGQSAEGYAAGTGQVASDDDIAQIAEMWKQTLNDLKKALIAMIPLGKLLLGVVDTVAKAIAGIGDMVKAVSKGQWGKAFGFVAAAGVSLVTDILKVFDVVTGLISRVPGLGKLKSNFAGSYSAAMSRDLGTMGLNTTEQSEGGAIGQVVEAGIGGAAAKALTKKVLGKVSDSLLTKAVETESEKTFKAAGMVEKLAPVVAKTIGYAATGALISRMAGQGVGSVAGTKGATNLPYNAQFPTSFLQMTGGESANLKFGGIYTTGIQSRQLMLTQQMRDLLAQLVKNTQYNNQYTGYGMIPSAYAPSGL